MTGDDTQRYLRGVAVMAAARGDSFASLASYPRPMLERIIQVAAAVPGSAQQTWMSKYRSKLYLWGGGLVVVAVIPLMTLVIVSGTKDPAPWMMSAIALLIGAFLSLMMWRLFGPAVLQTTKAVEAEHRLAPLAPAPGDDEIVARLRQLHPVFIALGFVLFAVVAVFFYFVFSS